MTVCLLLYKHKRLFDLFGALIRLWTRSKYSHCELGVRLNGDEWDCFSSSVMDKGVRRKTIDVDLSHWDIVELDWIAFDEIESHYNKTKNDKYDFLAILFSQVINARIHADRASFCSEWCASALGFESAETYSPELLANVCKSINFYDVRVSV